ncbi:MAG: helix-turn-helix domain-containing protein [Bacteroidales bacterium]|nr:helix-turn-helix domain-containing protein [Bacteroidales bacterium]
MYICVMINELNRLDLYERSNNDIVVDLGRRFRDYRIALRMTQQEIASQSGISVMTIMRFERGEGATIRFDNFVALMRTIQRLEGIADCIPDMPTSLYDTPARKGIQRVKKRSDEK